MNDAGLRRLFTRLAFAAVTLALVVIVLGAYTRLTDAGLGCPDWPGCYGLIKAPETQEEMELALQAHPEARIETHKAWNEMIHRYAAGTLGLLILALAIIAWLNRRDPLQPVLLPVLLVFIVGFQAALGMWTVTMLLRPTIVTLHLLTGLTTLGLLLWVALRSRGVRGSHEWRPELGKLRRYAGIGLLVLAGQIALGGWTSTNYAALHCPDFPTCQGVWLPDTNFSDAFALSGEHGVNYEGGVLEHEARVTIHFTHRLGAVVTLLYLGFLGITAIRKTDGLIRASGAAMLGILLAQVSLGIANVLLQLPLSVAVAHNGVAALLLLSVINLNHQLRR